MVKFENYIFLTICEKSYELFKKTKFMTFIAYCNNFKNCFKLTKFSENELSDINNMVFFIQKIYALKLDESFSYVRNFFIFDKYIIFEESSRLTMEYYNNCYN